MDANTTAGSPSFFGFAYSPDQLKLLELLKESKSKKKKSAKLILMTAPSFVVDFDYKKFAPLARGLGFDKVTELTFGAKIVNQHYHKYIGEKKHSQAKFISSVCPASVDLVKNQFPKFKKFLLPFDSPMIAMAKVLKKTYPKHKIVFAAPCSAKKTEALSFNKINKKVLIDCVVTFSELKQIFAKEKPALKGSNTFDSFYNEYTKVYPLAGGLSATLHAKDILSKKELVSCDGCNNLQTLFNAHSDKTFYDILFCKGGCIGGNGVASKAPTFLKKRRVLNYKKAASRIKEGQKMGIEKYTKGIDFGRGL